MAAKKAVAAKKGKAITKRPKASAPRTGGSGVLVSVRLTPAQRATLALRAKQQGTTMAGIIRGFLAG